MINGMKIDCGAGTAEESTGSLSSREKNLERD